MTELWGYKPVPYLKVEVLGVALNYNIFSVCLDQIAYYMINYSISKVIIITSAFGTRVIIYIDMHILILL